jgi:hypothetical protein
MAHFAKIGNDNIVTQVIVASKEVIESGIFGNPQYWYQTSYNTRGNVYYNVDDNVPAEDQSKAFRKNFAGVGFYYSKELDAFIPPKPYDSWILNEDTCLWEAPTPYPANTMDGYKWDEPTLSWVLI